jgi:hypothetical protein
MVDEIIDQIKISCVEIHWHRISRNSFNYFQLIAFECQEERQSSN